MYIKEILARVDHTLLSVTATWEEIKKTLDEAIKYRTASACIPPCFVRKAKEYVGDRLAICTVIGFPNGYSTTASKAFEAADAVKNGADEIDMVINVGALKEGRADYVEKEIREVKKACGDKILKVIIETCLLTDEQKIAACKAVTASGADFIKTSTGFSLGGATEADVALLRANVGKNVKVKAAGGIKSLKDAENFIALGADRLGTSRIVGLVESRDNKNPSDSGKRE